MKNFKIKPFAFINPVLISLLAYFLIIVSPPPANAEDISLSVSPSILQIQLNPSTEKTTPISIENHGDEAVNIKVLFKPFEPSGETGQIRYINENQIPQKYKNILTGIKLIDNGIVTSTFELAPKQKKNLALHFDIKKNEKYSDYYFSVVFLASPEPSAQAGLAGEAIAPEPTSELEAIEPQTQNQQKNYSILNAGIAANVILSIGSDKPQGYTQEFSAPAYLQSGPVEFTVRIKNAGRHHISPKGFILIKNIFGQSIGRIDIASDKILSGSIRSLTDTASAKQALLTDEEKASSSAENTNLALTALTTDKMSWKENFLLGPYTANLSVAVSEKGPIYNQSIFFFAMPIYLIFALLAAILIIVSITIRIRHKLKTRK